MKLIHSIASPAWAAGFRVFTSRCEGCHRSLALRHLSAQKAGITMHGCWYCSSACFKAAAEKKLSELLSTGQEQVNHVSRMPLGLLLIGRSLLTAEQLREATDAQKEAGGEIGEILSRYGFVSEKQVTGARAVELPGVFRSEASDPDRNSNSVSSYPALFRNSTPLRTQNEAPVYGLRSWH